MARFKKGQQVVCVAKNPDWRFSPPLVKTYLWGFIRRTITKAFGPQYNEVVTCDGYSDGFHMFISEYDCKTDVGVRPAWGENNFEPLIEDAELEKELSTISNPKEVQHHG